MIKTIPKREFDSLYKIRRKYYNHMMNNYNTMIAQIFALYQIKIWSGKNKQKPIYFVVLGNIFKSDLEI